MKKGTEFVWTDIKRLFPNLRWSLLNSWILNAKVDCVARGHGRKRIFTRESITQIKARLAKLNASE